MRFRRLSIILVATLAMLSASVPLAADPLEPDDGPGIITCTAIGIVDVFPTASGTTWSVAGAGSCQGDRGGPWFLDFRAVGTSSNLGLCSASNPEPVVENLSLAANLNLVSPLGLPKPLLQRWYAPLTTYPITTPFLIDGAGEIGAGTMFTRIFAQCPTAGSPVAQFDLAFYDN